MKLKLLIAMILILSGCATNNDICKVQGDQAVQPVGQVFAKVNINHSGLNEFRCSDYFGLTQKINLSYLHIDGYETVTREHEGIIYRIQMPHIHVQADTLSSIKESLDLKAFEDYELECKSKLVSDEYKITTTIYDEGYQETRDISVWEKIEIDCYYSPYDNHWECYYIYYLNDPYEFENNVKEEIISEILK